ncbi:hypothetical protein ACFL27_20830, partial [candidate division CSSED10-310 bacterium]
ISQQLGNKPTENWCLAFLGLLAHFEGNQRQALELTTQAYQQMKKTEHLSNQGIALLFKAWAEQALGLDEQSEQTYHQILAHCRTPELAKIEVEAKAGLSGLFLSRGEVKAAHRLVVEIMAYLEKETLDGTRDRFRIYLTCYQVLNALPENRAGNILLQACDLLKKMAARISDRDRRRSFLENVPSHRDLLKECEAQSGEMAVL